MKSEERWRTKESRLGVGRIGVVKRWGQVKEHRMMNCETGWEKHDRGIVHLNQIGRWLKNTGSAISRCVWRQNSNKRLVLDSQLQVHGVA